MGAFRRNPHHGYGSRVPSMVIWAAESLDQGLRRESEAYEECFIAGSAKAAVRCELQIGEVGRTRASCDGLSLDFSGMRLYGSAPHQQQHARGA